MELEWRSEIGEDEEKLLILPNGRKRIIYRCRSRKDGRCNKVALFKVSIYYDGKLVRTIYFCRSHLKQWLRDLEEDEARGVLSFAWDYEIKTLVTPRTLKKWLRECAE